MIPIFQHTHQSYASAIVASLGKGKRHAILLYSEWFRHGSLEGLKIELQAQELVKKMVAMTDFSLPQVQSFPVEGGIQKLLVTFPDGHKVESVIIPMRAGHTLCVSSQVGCQMGCAFCQTGQMGLLRNLHRSEIVTQFFCAQQIAGRSIHNVVFMGMGEPFDNYDEVMGAVAILADVKGLRLGMSRITISTSGRVDGIDRMTHEADPALNLAVSVNAPNDLIRQKIMPINRKWKMTQLKEAMLRYCQNPRRKIFVEYVLLAGVNDELIHADQLAEYLEGIRATVNLIPYNPGRAHLLSLARYKAPSDQICRQFLQRMKEKGFMATLRGEKGRQAMAACGQLYTQNVKARYS